MHLAQGKGKYRMKGIGHKWNAGWMIAVLIMTGFVIPSESFQKGANTGEKIDRQTLASGGNVGTSPNFCVNSATGQPATGTGTSTTYGLSQGFWSSVSPGSCCDKPGDANNDGTVNVGDAVYIIGYIFRGGPVPPCTEEGDANGDGKINIGDAVYIVSYVFRGGLPPLCGT